MAKLLLGPVLRHVGRETATVWVETDRPCEVKVLDSRASTFTVHGHHYALVDVTGLSPGATIPYDVRLDEARVWPAESSAFPPPVIRTQRADRTASLLFGSCRVTAPDDDATVAQLGVDMLRRTADAVASGTMDTPDALLMIGDQVYADRPPEDVRAFIRERRDTTVEPGEEANDFEEYARLYRAAWGDERVAWLLSTVPVYTMFDDHDLRDDWNTSAAWREAIRERPWWPGRVRAGLGSYWVYQHAGNLSPEARVADPVHRAVTATHGDAGAVLDEWAWRADDDPDGYRWSYTLDIGRSRVIMLDTRCGRVLTPGARRMISKQEADWLAERTVDELDHLLIASSLPVLLPPVLHYAEGWSESVADGAWGRYAARFVERLRQLIDLEHWPAFGTSFAELARLVTTVSRRENGPASVLFLSGDIHYSYLATVRTPPGAGRVHQLVSSPFRNPLSGHIKWANTFAAVRGLGAIGRLVAALAKVPPRPLRWRLRRGPWFDNAIGRIDLDARAARARWYRADPAGGVAVIAHSRLTEE
ncbi:alkaline phosphatase D family protein [Stackebrandtia soli]|uniref:alkaline phosphatase D family protein n=1 Tax=Stackebrandtia soli TaxID=1892856 RepID=UPI0039ED9347